MPSINLSLFADKAEDGRKRKTIRKGNRFKKGDPLYCFTGLRTAHCKGLDFTKAIEKHPDIDWGLHKYKNGIFPHPFCKEVISTRMKWWTGESQELTIMSRIMGRQNIYFREEREALAISDGFDNLKDFETAFLKMHPEIKDSWQVFQIICW